MHDIDDVALRRDRLRSHRLSAPAATPVAAARHLLATQAQEFWGGRWALAVRSRGTPSLAAVDRAFDRGALVRSWTMRGTIHVCAAEDLPWLLSVTAGRQLRLAAGRHRQLGLDEDVFDRAERVARVALRGGARLTRAQLSAVLDGSGVDVTGQRGIHVLQALSLRGVVCHGPIVPRPDGPTREQHLVLVEDWVTDAASPPDPAVELFCRYIEGHGPATAADFAWWSGLPLRVARAAAETARDGGDRVRAAEDRDGVAWFTSRRLPRASATAPQVVALPPFDEYYLSYLDRGRVCALPHRRLVGPGANGMISPLLLDRGLVVGRWTHSRAVGRHREGARAELFEGADTRHPPTDDAAVAAALDRYAAFLRG